MLRKILHIMLTGLLAGSLFLAGCGREEKKPGMDAETDMHIVASALERADQTDDREEQIKYLRTAYVMAGELETRWPDSEKVPVFLEENAKALDGIPDRILAISMKARDLESFQWAVERSAKVELHYEALVKIWEMGRYWREFYIREYPEQSLPIFMSEAANSENEKFFNRHIEAFAAGGYKLTAPLMKEDFQARFGAFIAEMIKNALENRDMERVDFLLTHMPPAGSEPVNEKTAAAMRMVGRYAAYDLQDEALTCRLVELGYDMGRINVDKTGFGREFARVLVAHPEHAVTRVLHLDEWHGPLTEKETRFLLVLPDSALRLVHPPYLNQAIRAAMQAKDNKKANRIMAIREEVKPLSLQEYEQLLGWSMEYRNNQLYTYVKAKIGKIDPYTLNLAELGGSWSLFRLHAPTIFKKIYPTMDLQPVPDGTTIGRIDQLLTSSNPQAVHYVVSKYDLRQDWAEARVPRSLLMAVCEGGNLEAAKYLVETKRADVNAETFYSEEALSLFGQASAREGKLTPLFFAAMSGNSELIEYLVQRRANVNARSHFGATPLMYAVMNDQTEAARTLLQLGANVNAAVERETAVRMRDRSAAGLYAGDTAYILAKRRGNDELQSLLREAGAR